MRFLFIFFILVPLGEMLLLFEVSDRIGSLTTLGMVVATAVIGVQILKRQGFATLTRANQKLQSGQLPAQEIVEGMLLAAAGRASVNSRIYHRYDRLCLANWPATQADCEFRG